MTVRNDSGSAWTNATPFGLPVCYPPPTVAYAWRGILGYPASAWFEMQSKEVGRNEAHMRWMGAGVDVNRPGRWLVIPFLRL